MALENRSDEEWQAWFEGLNGTPPFAPDPDDESFRLYRQLFDALATEPATGLSYGFSARVVRRIQEQDLARQERRAYGYVAAGILLMIGAALGLQAIFGRDDFRETLRAVFHYRYPVLFALGLLMLIQWADRRLVKRKIAE
ncbi:hypothetical protein [Larkinella soli]|uniref:hypothetical protein n=1 Tax=Larkinella soli TaxID=1770527 RepID=UPI000FFC4844|nr:hypothetical protein [Larkinella soli]